MEQVHDDAKLIYCICHMGGGCLGSRGTQSEGLSRDEDGSCSGRSQGCVGSSASSSSMNCQFGPRSSIRDTPGIGACSPV